MTTAQRHRPSGEVPALGEGGMPFKRLAAAILALSMGGFAIGVTEFSIMGLLQEAVADLGVSIPQADI